VREHVLAMKEIWTSETASFAGEFVEFRPLESWPKPVQLPLPVLIGGGPGEVTFRHIAEYSAGWLPRGVRGLAEAVPRLRDCLAANDRDPAGIDIIPFSSGDVDQRKWDWAEANGATEVVLDVPPGPRDAVQRALDELAAAIDLRRAGRIAATP
jgi:alkanesulfonate monooxygenase SsuD/methylene tetrahydromethanopterin reductase-like flavin-dependent oxidoreductase (luciferase family)